MKQSELLKSYSTRLRLYNLTTHLEEIVHKAQENKPTYLDFILQVLQTEVQNRDKRDYERRLNAAHLPARHDLDLFDYHFCSSITQHRMKELRELMWMEQSYNLILMGPSGTGKTFIAAGLIYEAVRQGYKAYMLTMEDIITTIKMKEISPTAMTAYNKMVKADLIAIDDIMLFPVKKEDATGFFNLINTLHEKTSIIITTNKAPTEWAMTLNDEVLATALLDRLLYRCEVVKLTGTSYRLENRKTIFKQELFNKGRKEN